MATQVDTTTTTQSSQTTATDQSSPSLFTKTLGQSAAALPAILLIQSILGMISDVQAEQQINSIGSQSTAAKNQKQATIDGAKEAFKATWKGAVVGMTTTVVGAAISTFADKWSDAQENYGNAHSENNNILDTKKMSDLREMQVNAPQVDGHIQIPDHDGIQNFTPADVNAERGKLAATGKSIFTSKMEELTPAEQVIRTRYDALDDPQQKQAVKNTITQQAINTMGDGQYTEFRAQNEADVTRGQKAVNAASERLTQTSQRWNQLGELLKGFGQQGSQMWQAAGQKEKAKEDGAAQIQQLISSLAGSNNQQFAQNLAKYLQGMDSQTDIRKSLQQVLSS